MAEVLRAAILSPACVNMGKAGRIVNKNLCVAFSINTGVFIGSPPIRVNEAKRRVSRRVRRTRVCDRLVGRFAVGTGCARVKMFAWRNWVAAGGGKMSGANNSLAHVNEPVMRESEGVSI